MMMPPAVPSGCSRTSRPKNLLSPACPAASAPGSVTAGVNCDTSPIGFPRYLVRKSRPAGDARASVFIVSHVTE